VTVVGSADEALESLERERPDVLVSDVAMPDKGGTCRSRRRSMKKRPVRPLRLYVGLVGLLLCWFWLVPIAHAATARAELKDERGTTVGEASLQDTPAGVKISATFTALPPGERAFHVHAVGKCEPPFESAGGHFNPAGKQHGRDNPQGAHAGDLPNVQVTATGRATIEAVIPDMSLTSGPAPLLDRDGASLVVHEGADDYRSDPAGNAGRRIACGVIRESRQ